jgi:2-haloacid dehalogenase
MSLEPTALLFDTFGTVVDWRGSIIGAGEMLAERCGLDEIDWAKFAEEWRREGYIEPIGQIVRGEREWEPVDRLLRHQLDVLLHRHGLDALAEADRLELFGVWRRLTPWPDAVAGLTRLKGRYIIGPLSNGGFALLTEMAKAVSLPWDCIISAELFRAYKPSPAVYLGAASMLDLPPDRVMLVAAHPHDLDAARTCGLQTAHVPRPLEWGPDATPSDPGSEATGFDFVAQDFLDLADKLGG